MGIQILAGVMYVCMCVLYTQYVDVHTCIIIGERARHLYRSK